jgi:hypothetical protein
MCRRRHGAICAALSAVWRFATRDAFIKEKAIIPEK